MKEMIDFTLPIKWLLIDGLPHDFFMYHFSQSENKTLNTRLNKAKISRLDTLDFSCQTPPSLFSIWSGQNPHHFGITGYDVPMVNTSNEISMMNGFMFGKETTAKMIWEACLAEDKSVAICGVPFIKESIHNHPKLHGLDLFSETICSTSIHKISQSQYLTVNEIDSLFHFEISSQVVTVSSILDGAILDTHQVLMNHFFSIKIFSSKLQNIFDVSCGLLNIENSIYFTILSSNKVNPFGTFKKALFDYYPNTISVSILQNQYRQGQLGTKIIDGGNGTAEQHFLAAAKHVNHQFQLLFEAVYRLTTPHLYLCYYPIFDLIAHEMFNLLTHSSDNHTHSVKDGDVPKAIWTLIEAIMESFLATSDKPSNIIINSDHGMLPLSYEIFPNTYFVDKDLLILDKNNHFRLNESTCVFHPAENGLILFNKKHLASLNKTPPMILNELIDCLRKQKHVSPFTYTHLPSYPNIDKRWACYFLFSGDGYRIKSSIANDYVQKSKKGGDHSTKSSNPSLDGVLLYLKPDSANSVSDHTNKISVQDIIKTCLYKEEYI